MLEQLRFDASKLPRTNRRTDGTFAPGNTGNPNGRMSEREAAEQLRLAAHEVIKTRKSKHKGQKKLRRISEKIVELAMKGEPWACNMVFDRLDGKPMQFIDQTTTYEVGDVFIDLLRALNEKRGKVIEHEPADRTPADGGMATVGS